MSQPNNSLEKVAAAFREGAELRHETIKACGASIVAAAEAVGQSLRNGGKVLLFGNGGSAADSQHIAAEFVGRFVRERRALPAIALTTDTSAMTSIGNDYGFDFIFERPVRAFGRRGDVVIAISTSGRSPNILNALAAARELGLTTIALTGARGVEFARQSDIGIVVPSSCTARIQEIHITIGHLICELVDDEVASGGGAGAS
jgi:D-sedoheptulose 7-phosphate isomerase